MLIGAAVERKSEIDNYAIGPLEDSGEENRFYFSKSHFFYEGGGSEATLRMCNFKSEEFEYVWVLYCSYVIAHYKVGRGRKSEIKCMDAFFIMLTALKMGASGIFYPLYSGKSVHRLKLY